jgi:hypothetical protein
LNVNDFLFIPNPNKGNFNVQFTSQSGNEIKVILHDLLGRKLFEKHMKTPVILIKTFS